MNTLVPENIKGKPVDLSKSASLSTREEALDCFKRAYKRLLNPPVWHQLTGALGAEFLLVNHKGEQLDRLIQPGDYLRINIPGPGSTLGEGYDWVKVEAMEDKTNADAEEESITIRVRACKNPTTPENDVAHFFQDEATSTFIVQRIGNTVTAYYYGRNELPNTNTSKTTDNIRNTLMAMGAMAGLSELHWSSLIKGLLTKEIGGNEI